MLSIPTGVAADGQGNVYITEYNPNRVRKVSPGGTISLFAGNGTVGVSGDGGPATSAALTQPHAVAADLQRNVYIVSAGIRRVDPAGTITTITSGSGQSLGDGGPAQAANLTADSVAVDPQGKNLYIFDFQNDRVRKVTHAPKAKGSPSTTPTAAWRTRSRPTSLRWRAGERR